VVLERGEPPPGFAAAVRAIEQAQADRARRAEHLLAPPRAGSLVPVLAPGTRLERRAVLAGHTFAWGDVLCVPHRPEAIEVSPLIRRLAELCDGRRTVADLVAALRGPAGPRAVDALAGTVREAVRILYVDGAIAELRTEAGAG
jgi:hypothetical protein